MDRAMQSGETVPGGLQAPHAFARIPCWTVFRGAEAGKNFEISTEAVITVRDNIVKIGNRVTDFNNRYGYTKSSPHTDHLESGWPKPIV
jgi:hypothetical protein